MLRVFPCKFWQVLVYLDQQILNFPSNLFTHFDKPKNSLELPNPTRNIHKCLNKFMTNTSGEITLQSKQLGYCLLRSESETCNFSALCGSCDTFFSVCYIPFESNASKRDWSKSMGGGGWARAGRGWVIRFWTLGKGWVVQFLATCRGWVILFLLWELTQSTTK